VNERRLGVAGGLALALTVLLAVSPARAVIEALTPLETIINKDSHFIFTAKVVKIDPKKPSAVLEVGDALKGKVPFTRLPINLTGDDYAKKHEHTPQLLKRLAEKLPVIVFVNKTDKKLLALAYTNGTWLQLTAEEDGENPVWSFTHCEPYLRRTFKGTTAEMQEAVSDSVSGKKAAPKPNPKEKPGLGPEVEEKPKDKDEKPAPGLPLATGGAASGPPFAVIPSVAIGGLLSLLAMLFPAVFGGLTGQLKRWMAMISVASLNGTLIWLQDFFQQELGGTWWGTRTALWLTMTGITVAGLLWAWRRHLAELSSSREPSAGADSSFRDTINRVSRLSIPSRYEQIILLILSGLGVVLFAVCLLLKYPIRALPWSFVLVLWVGIWSGTLHVVLLRRSRRPRTQPPLASEGVILGAMVLACLALGNLGGSVIATDSAGGGTAQGGGHGAKFLGATPIFAPQGSNGHIDGKPLIDGDRLYAGGAHSGAFGTSFGAVYCLERSTGKLLWRFNADGKMKQVFSSPCLAGGKLYIGEGLHSDSDCKLYCLDAETGQKLWERPTQSHTESSPCVADGKVYCGAGGDGLLCLNAATGEDVWQYKGGHIDCPPVVVGGRVYAGCGVDRDVTGPQETAIFCLDAQTGQEVWRVKTNLPAWGKPAVAGDQAFFPLGNGDASHSEEAPAGAVVCVSTREGKEAWRFDVPDGVIEGPAIDLERGHLYFGSRDGHCYCVGRHDGRLRWKHDLGSAVVASPALAMCSACGVANSVFAIASGDPDKRVPPRICCLDPLTGRKLWEYDEFPDAQVISPPAVTVEHSPEGDRRTVYFGATIHIKPADPLDNQVVLYALKDQWKEE